ncbi:MAG: hypothetical protein AB7S70_05440 [Hyphomicrobium sp.]|uniref:hypothetical protein n=1 Tax=Hyphomicrobium sp. TaxID=82 RepID=UPI003D12FC1D
MTWRFSLCAACFWAGLAGPAQAGYIDLCNVAERKIRVAVIIKTGFDYLTDSWAVKGWYYIGNGSCERIDGGWLGGGRSWGYVAIEREKSAEDMEYERKLAEARYQADQLELQITETLEIYMRKREAIQGFSFYDHLVKYLPGSQQSTVAGKFDAEADAVRQRSIPPMPQSYVEGWEFLSMKTVQNSIDEEGFTGTSYKTCLPKGGFNFSRAGQPSDRSSCDGDDVLVPFTIEVWVRSGSDMVVNVGEDSIHSERRY